MRLFLIDIIGFLIIIIGLIFFASKKFKMEKSHLIILYLTMLPIIVFMVSSDITKTLVSGLENRSLDITHLIFIFLFVIEFGFVSMFIIIRFNAFTKTYLPEHFNKDLIWIEKSIRILNLACYSYIINLLFTIPLILMITLGATFMNVIFGCLPGAIVLLIPIDAYLYVIVTSSIAIVFIVTYIFIINGTMRFLSKSKFSKEQKILYTILMLIPIVNFASTINLRDKAEAVLKIEGIDVGIFSTKMIGLKK